MPSKTTTQSEPKQTTAKAVSAKAATTKTSRATPSSTKRAAAKPPAAKSTAANKPKATKPAAAKPAAAKTTKATAPKKAPARAAKPTKAPAAKTRQATIGDTVRAVVDAAAAIVGAAVAVNAAVGPKKGKTGKQITKALEMAEGVTAAAAALVDLNRAAPDALASLKGIGPKRAQKIVESRPFQAVDDLAARKLLPKKAVEELRDLLSV